MADKQTTADRLDKLTGWQLDLLNDILDTFDNCCRYRQQIAGNAGGVNGEPLPNRHQKFLPLADYKRPDAQNANPSD